MSRSDVLTKSLEILGRNTPTAEEFPAILDLAKPNVIKNIRGMFSFHPLFALEKNFRKQMYH